MKTLIYIFTFMSLFVFQAKAAESLFRFHENNDYVAINPKTNTVFGTIRLTSPNTMVFFYGADGKIWLNGQFQLDEEGDRRLTAALIDNDNTTIWVDSAQLQIDLSQINLEQVRSPIGVLVNQLYCLPCRPS